MFEDSERSLAILNYIDTKYGQLIAPIGLFKACAVISSQLQWPRLSVLAVAPSRQFKSQTLKEVEAMFPEERIIHAGSDFTIHRLFNQTRGDVEKKCIAVNDGTLLLRSKARRSKDRLMNGLAELISDGEYQYGDNQNAFTISGACTAIINMTLEAYERYERDLLSSTFLERFITLFYNMPEEEQHHYYEFKEKMAEDAGTPPTIRPNLRWGRMMNLKEYRPVLSSLAKDYSALSMRSFLGCVDQVEALASSHAVLNDRFWLCEDDLEIVRLARDYLSNPASPNKSKIIQMHKQGRSQSDICLLLNRNYESYRPFVSKVLKEAKLRGID